MPQIVYIDISQTAVEAASNLQQMGAIVSVGGTTLTAGTYQAITSASDLTAIATSASADVGNAVNSFYKQGTGSVYILELGSGAVIGTALAAFISAHPNTFYAYTVPNTAYSDTTFQAMVKNFVSLNSMTYFFVNGTQAGYAPFSGVKSVAYFVAASGAASTENLAAETMYEFINATPSSAKKLAPFAFRYLYGSTAWTEAGNAATFATLRSEYVNIAGSGARGGVSETLLYWGYFMDGKPMSYWYAVDWAQINLAQDLSYEIIIGSNSTTAPLIYDQRGITRLQSRATQTLTTATAFGVIVGQSTVSAVDFATYVSQNTGDYSTGTYNGLSATITPMRGFEQITFYLTVDFTGTAVVDATSSTGS